MISSKTLFELRRVSVIFGGVLVGLTAGTTYTFGNMNTYVTSYLRYSGVAPTLTYTECSWVFVALQLAQGPSTLLAAAIETKIGSRLTCLLGSMFLSLGTALSYFSINNSFAATLVTFGVMEGIGIGMCHMMPMNVAIRWAPNRPGLAYGLVNSGVGGGKLIFNILQTRLINPNNKGPAVEGNGERYFNAVDVMNRIPTSFLLLGAIYASLQLVGCFLLVEPPQEIEAHTVKLSRYEDGIGDTVKKDDVTTPLIGKHDETIHHRKITEQDDWPLSRVLRSWDFCKISMINFSTAMAIIFLNTLYKAFGLSFIDDDVFLSLVGTFAAVFSFLGRVIWGFVSDISFRICSMIVITMVTSLLFTLPLIPFFSEGSQKYVFLLFICLLYGTAPAFYTLIPTALAKRFGQKNLTRNIGVSNLNLIITAPLTAILSDRLQKTFGWTYVFFVIAGVYYTAFFAALTFKGKDKQGRDV